VLPRAQGAPELLLAAAVELLLGPVVVVELLLGPVVVFELLGPVVVFELEAAVGEPPPVVVVELDAPIVIGDPPNDPVLLLAGPELVTVEVVTLPPPDDGPVGSAGFAQPCDATTTIHAATSPAPASFHCIMTNHLPRPSPRGRAMRRARCSFVKETATVEL
jgi:hypothetical protein